MEIIRKFSNKYRTNFYSYNEKYAILFIINFLKETAFLTGKYKGNEKAIIKELEKGLQRKLNAEEIETINFFVNGYCLERV